MGSIHECYLHVCTVRVPLEQCFAWLVRAMYLSCSCLYCACTIAQCVLCLYSLYSILACPARVMYLLTRVCTRTVAQCVLCLYPLYSDSAWPARAMYVRTVLVSPVQWSGMASTGNVHFARFYSYCACTIAQCVLCMNPLYSGLAWPARAVYLLVRVLTRTGVVPLHSVYCACASCTVVRYGQHG